jgi:hypothetical protein
MPARPANVAMMFGSGVTRNVTVISSSVTPVDVAPPLSPSNAKHGGE